MSLRWDLPADDLANREFISQDEVKEAALSYNRATIKNKNKTKQKNAVEIIQTIDLALAECQARITELEEIYYKNVCAFNTENANDLHKTLPTYLKEIRNEHTLFLQTKNALNATRSELVKRAQLQPLQRSDSVFLYKRTKSAEKIDIKLSSSHIDKLKAQTKILQQHHAELGKSSENGIIKYLRMIFELFGQALPTKSQESATKIIKNVKSIKSLKFFSNPKPTKIAKPQSTTHALRRSI